MTSFYTRTGDDGYTGLLGGERVPKYGPKLEAIGALDELTSILAIARNHCRAQEVIENIIQVQRYLHGLMSEVAANPEVAERYRLVNEEQVTWIETIIDAFSEKVQIQRKFILPGDTLAGAYLDLARTVTRRAERRVVELQHKNELSNLQILRFLNRLSALFFVLELYENQIGGINQPTLTKNESQ